MWIDSAGESVNSGMPMPLLVQKYGGSSLATPRLIRRAAERIKQVKASGRDVVVVASAMGRMTDHLVRLAHKTVKRPPQRELDMLLTAGERISMSLLAMVLQEEGIPAISFTGSQSGIITSRDHNEARILAIRAHRIQDELAKGKVAIVAGFQGVSEDKEVTTLGRGGSDTSAVALAASLGAEACEILTDVDGLFSADPRLVPNARLIPRCSYDEALELASLGAKMHARSIEVAKRFGVVVRILSSHKPECLGTVISTAGGSMESTTIRSVATKDGFVYLRCRLPLKELAERCEAKRLLIRFMAHGNEGTGFLVEKDKLAVAHALVDGSLLEEVGKVGLVSAVGEGVSTSPEILPRFLRAIHQDGTECLLVSSNATSVTAAIPSARLESAARAVHAALVEP